MISQGRILNQLPPSAFHSLQTEFFDDDRDRLALECCAGDGYRGLGGDAVATLRASAALQK